MTATTDTPVIGLTARTMRVRSSNRLRAVEAVGRTFVDALEAAGARAVLLPNSSVPARAAGYLDLVHGVVLTGGDDPHPSLFGEAPHPKVETIDERRDRFEVALIREAHTRGLPTLGVCRGAQMMNVALGGDIFQDIPSQTDSTVGHVQRTLDDRPWHDVDIEVGSRLATLLGAGVRRVNSYHHQACRRVGKGLAVAAKTCGDGLIEALEDPQMPYFIGVQWHPELEPDESAIWTGLVQAARDRLHSAS
ncbi:MAG: gamma-glutamyl-gamma-aminobutyrate hydrolase family protein [Planctomycetota bacterium]|nr:gamma-glutamyl-gamma-aminobutyrate hydrolase family protein [Planctomycetota bacterium]